MVGPEAIDTEVTLLLRGLGLAILEPDLSLFDFLCYRNTKKCACPTGCDGSVRTASVREELDIPQSWRHREIPCAEKGSKWR